MELSTQDKLDIIELAALETLQELGWSYLHGSVIAPDGAKPERRSFGDVILVGRLMARKV